MKPIAEQDLYEILEVPREADPEQIEQGYRIARSVYEEGGDALYSVFDDAAAGDIRERIEAAYEVLSDPAARRAYDARLGARAPADGGGEHSGTAAPEPPAPPPPEPGDSLDPEANSPVFDGPRLRRSRLRRGLELDRIAEITKISATYLRFLEEERFESLPANVYVRGFVKAFASCVGLDPHRVSQSYMERCEGARSERGARWLRTRR